MTPQDLIAAFETVAEAPEGVTRLRELVLQLAVRGKLVPQDPEDEPASVLLEQIEKEKARLVKQKAIRKPREGGLVGEEEQPFELPNGWAWAKLDDLTHDLGQKLPDAEFSYIDVGTIDNQRGVITDEVAVIAAADAPSRARKLVRDGTVIFSTVRPYLLNVAVVEREYSPEPIASTAFAVLHPHVGMSNRFLFRLLRSPFFVEYVAEQMKGVAYPAINDANLLRAPIPVPPTAEQHRIVARVDELMGLLDRLEAARQTREVTRAAVRDAALAALRDADTPEEVEVAWNRVAERMDDLFTDPTDVGPLRQTVLQLAVRGRLVPQDPTDEPASVLLERIGKEKARLVKSGKIRKEKPLPPVLKDAVPFGVPEGWEWCQLDRLVDPGRSISYGVLVPGPDVDGGVPLVRVADLDPRTPPEKPAKSISPRVAAEYERVRLLGDELLISVVGSIGKVGVAHPGWAGAVVARAVARFGVAAGLNRDYVLLLLQSPHAQKHFLSATRTLAQPTLNVGLLRQFPSPVPPLAEQHRIVAKVNELMGLIDQLEERLAAKAKTHDAFAAAAVHHLDV